MKSVSNENLYIGTLQIVVQILASMIFFVILKIYTTGRMIAVISRKDLLLNIQDK